MMDLLTFNYFDQCKVGCGAIHELEGDGSRVLIPCQIQNTDTSSIRCRKERRVHCELDTLSAGERKGCSSQEDRGKLHSEVCEGI